MSQFKVFLSAAALAAALMLPGAAEAQWGGPGYGGYPYGGYGGPYGGYGGPYGGYGPYGYGGDDYYGSGRGYGRGYGRGHASGNFDFSGLGDMFGNGWGNGWDRGRGWGPWDRAAGARGTAAGARAGGKNREKPTARAIHGPRLRLG